MAAGLPAKTSWAANDVFTSAGANNLAGTVNLLGLSTVTATAAGTTVLTVASNRKQTFTGTTTQTVTLPAVSTLSLGDTFEINNSSTGVVTVQSSGANSVLAMATMTRAVFVCILASGTTAASWSAATSISPTLIDAAGDLLIGTADNTVGRLGIGTALQVLRTNAGATAPEWAPAASGGMTLISTTAITATASIDLTSISGAYKDLIIVIDGAYENSGSVQVMTFNNATTLFSSTLIQATNANTVVVATSAASIPICGSLRFPAGSGSGSVVIHIPNYASATMAKIARINSMGGNGAGSVAGGWAAIAAITSVKITWGGTPTAQGNVLLYGVN
jgi:hypothetical protein